jgi:uncharacterized membrane protein YagU involved in acid resistance
MKQDRLCIDHAGDGQAASFSRRASLKHAPSVRTNLNAALAGMIAVWVMDRFDWFAFRHVSPRARERTESVRPGSMDPAHALVAKAAEAAGIAFKPADPHQHPAGLAIHYAVPMGLAVFYATLKRRFPAIAVRKSSGALYGICIFIVLDEIINPMLGLAARPDRYPWQRHVRESTTHLIYGTAMDAVLGFLERQRMRRHSFAYIRNQHGTAVD